MCIIIMVYSGFILFLAQFFYLLLYTHCMMVYNCMKMSIKQKKYEHVDICTVLTDQIDNNL